MIFVTSSGTDFKRSPPLLLIGDDIQGGTTGLSHGMSWLDVGKGRGVITYKYYIRNKFSQPIRPILEWGGEWVGGRTVWTEHLLDGWILGH